MARAHRRGRRWIVAVAAIVLSAPLAWAGPADTKPPVDIGQALRDLKSKDMETRRAAVDEVAFSEDPRVAEACLTLIYDRGQTTARKAMRMIGSRARVIPKKDRPRFAAALRKWAATHDGNDPYYQRALGLLTEDYRSAVFCKSPDGRYVIYERLGVPEVIDTQGGQYRLLVAPGESGEILYDVYGAGYFDPSAVHWTPDSKMVAVELQISRHHTGLAVWVAGGETVKALEPKRLYARFAEGRSLGEDEYLMVDYEFAAWKGGVLGFTLSGTAGTVRVAYDVKSGKVSGAKVEGAPRAGE